MRLTQTSASQPVKRGQSTGFTLTELLVASAITSVVLLLAGSGLVTLLTADQAAEQRQNRKQELNRALAFIGDDIRAAQRINQDASGTVALSLEIPIPTSKPPDTCTPPPFDHVTYEVRPKNSQLWRGPYILYRHGRIPGLDGSISPCSKSDPSKPSQPKNVVLVDGLLNENPSIKPSCGPTLGSSAVLSGIGGFYTCVTGGQVALILRGDGSPQSGASQGNSPSMDDIVPVTLSSIVFQRGVVSGASPTPTPTTMCYVPYLVGQRPTVPEPFFALNPNDPDLVGKQTTDAQNEIRSANLIDNAVADPMLNTASGIVASQIPAPESKLPCGHIVMFTYKP
jgi:prepilin-type N-terminal cleavage/methylation domain-containing protein